MSFDITFLGCSGGPIESSNCAILIKPAHISYNELLELPNGPLIMIDAGLGILLLAELIASEPRSCNRLLQLYDDSLPVTHYINIKRSHPFKGLKGLALRNLHSIFAKLAGVLISHPHADHILAMVLNLPSMFNRPNRLTMLGSKFTINTLQENVFNGLVWPDMILLGILQTQILPALSSTSICNESYTVIRFDLSHGKIAHSNKSYESLAFLLRCNASDTKLLVFGDLESDTVLGQPKNKVVWNAVAPYVLDATLKCIILECSIQTVAPGTELYGHLTPRHLIKELLVLNEIASTRKRKPLKDLNLIITHVKESLDGHDPRRRIKSELEDLNRLLGLGLSITIALSGVTVQV